MKQTVIRRNDCAVNDWAGGRTIQLAIYPPEAEYKARNFQFRLSTATSTLDGVAPFTMLPGIDRHLLILDGEMKVYHQGHYDIELHPYQEIDHFDGGWETRSEGKVRDFNLMLGEGCTGGLSVIFQSGAKTLGEKDTHAAFFCAEGSAVITTVDLLASGYTPAKRGYALAVCGVCKAGRRGRYCRRCGSHGGRKAGGQLASVRGGALSARKAFGKQGMGVQAAAHS